MFGGGRTKGSKNKKGTKKRGSSCRGQIHMACNRMPSCKYVYGKKRQFCRKSKNNTKRHIRFSS